ncbi:hypothetical protein MARLIPOL_07574 [Marinobacter lipolyticus SM19]|uniref:Uncharacterized protein n=1 Tax=Marinobacter lipolyticus SM19 TaxID=1318628 RepID=R8B233_9GAMM|nr:hypothetical protein [Marinobacter lipolyticus]EON92594.1 hypothetical protein MARLIPOL_07574 [Marinobacter lipolyticus SM19]
MSILIASATLLTASSAGLAYTYWQVLDSRRRLRVVNSHRIAANSAIQKSRMDLLEVRNRAKLLEETVTGGATAVEKVHKAISSTTFGLIDHFSRDDQFRQTARKARQTHDQTSQQIYHGVRTTNRALHILADTLIISKAEKRIISRKHKKRHP